MKEVIKKRKSVNYVNNPDFYASLVKYRDMIKENPAATIPNYIGICISSICNKLATKYNFASYTFRDEMIGDGIEHCIRAVTLFNPEKTNNPFAYITQIAWNAFIRRIKLENKENYIKHKNMYQMHISGDITENSGLDFGNIYSDKVLDNFESREKKKLTKLKESNKISLDNFLG